MTDLILTNARIVLPDNVIHGSLHAKNGLIATVDEGNSHLPRAIDCEQNYIIPGLIELHTDNIERHLMPRQGALWPAEAAVLNHDREVASVGITTVFNAICVGDVHARSVRMNKLEELCTSVLTHLQNGHLKAEHFLHLRCELSFGDLLAFLDPLLKLDRVALISLMDHTPGQRQFVNIEQYAEYYKGKFGMSEQELEQFMTERYSDQKKYSLANRKAVVSRAHAHNIRVASHDDATEAHVLEAIHDNIAIAEFPTTLEAAKACHNAGVAVLMGGPNIVRGKSNSGNISARHLAHHGLLDIISSDYVPSSLLYAALILDKLFAELSLPEVISKVTKNPANIVGLEDRGEIKPGLRADLVHFRKTNDAPIILDVWNCGKKIA